MNIHVLLLVLSSLALAACTFAEPSVDEAALIEAGHALARENCARCHGLGRIDDSPLEQAPPFRRLHERYPVDQLAEAFAEGIVVGHTEMPPFEFEPRQISALIAYLKSLEPRRPHG